MLEKLRYFAGQAARTARLMVGVQDYPTYVAHMAQCHPGHKVMTEVEFFRACQDARYPGKNGKISKCPC
ncbi:YbdD/YjiX family protein [Azospira inquinata]|uniref:YbdD/YjiX family protein n=1 Tax=Azospira inquinata TaxID=2785627 RepID=A0A975XV57_9RHOO|nr:CstA-like transporter-associated (seleno)protein [Azospira inquinata]QWT45193.1 YbdD/YjiX family protein [Azospira inquinata]QWT49474.1 YbdD/YjiX family protein [Azospira inquinata]